MSPPLKTALVTGGAGFIGSHLVDALVRRHVKVVVVDDFSRGLRSNVNPNVKVVAQSILSSGFASTVARVKPDTIFHLAAHIDVRASVKHPEQDLQVNTLGTLAALRASARAKVSRFVFISTGGAMFSDADRPPYSEDLPTHPMSPYGVSKRAAEQYVELLAPLWGMQPLIFRLANVYGPRQRADGEAGVSAIFARALLADKPLLISGTGKQKRDFVHVHDVVRAMLLALSKNATGLFHIGSGDMLSVNDLAKQMKRLSGSASPLTWGPAKAGEVMRSALNSNLAFKRFGWKPEISLDQGLRDLLQWMKTQKKM